MTPARTGGTAGHFEIDRVFPDVGRVRRSSGTSVLREFRRRDAILTKLYETGQLDALRAFKGGRLSMAQLVEHDRHGRGGETLEMIEARANLWEVVARVLPRMGKAPSTRLRYALSLRQLRERSSLGDKAQVADLRRVDWRALLANQWPDAPADWNRMRAAVSRFLSLAMGDKYSPFRRAIINEQTFPIAEEPTGRTPDLTPEQFLAALEGVSDDEVRAALMCLVLTGMRVGEYLSLDERALQPGNRRIRIPTRDGNKTGAGVISFESEEWGWIVAAVPFAGGRFATDKGYDRIYRAWKRALAEVGVVDVTLHDLRHCAGQWASDAGESTGAIGNLLRHKDPRQTLRYTQQKDAKRASTAVGSTIRLARGK